MRILIFSPLELPFTAGARYVGLERLAAQFAIEFARLGNEVAILAHKDTSVPPEVKLLPCEGYPNGDKSIHAEVRAFQYYQSEFRKYDVAWDITHLHLPARYMPNMPFVNIFHANPQYAFNSKYYKAPYNLVSWSKWGVREITKYYHNGVPAFNGGQKSVYQETIMIDSDKYKPSGKRGDRFLTIGRMSEDKGNLNAVMLAKKLNLKLDVAGGRGSEVKSGIESTPYEKHIMSLCDGEQIIFWGEISDEQKIQLMQSCKGLLYVTNHVEITSHKVQEAMLCGAPVIIPNLGGMPEIVTQGVDGYLCGNEKEYLDAVENIGKLEPSKTRDAIAQKYHPATVAKGYLELMSRVVNGERW